MTSKVEQRLRHIYRSASKADRNLIHELARQLDLAALLEQVLQESDEIEG